MGLLFYYYILSRTQPVSLLFDYFYCLEIQGKTILGLLKASSFLLHSVDLRQVSNSRLLR